MTHSPGPPAVTDVQPHVLEVQYKAETGTPKQVLKTLKRAYSSSVSCFETHIRLSSYQATLNKKLARKTLSDDDIQQIRRICENLVYIIQGPHDRNTYSVTLRLLSNVASSSDPVAFILCERHISSILRRVLEVSTDLPGPKVAALLQLLDHVHIRHRLSETRQRLSNAVRGQYPSADDISAAEEGCRELIELVRSASQTEIWVKMMVQDLLYLVAKQPNISFVLLEPSIYPHVAKIATSNFQGRSSGKLLRRLQRLVAESSPEILSLRKTLYPILAKGFIEEAGRPVLRELCQKLFRLVQRGSPYERLACLGLLETIAQTVTTIPEAFRISWVLTEPDFYETIEKMWALGPRSPVLVDQLYALVKQSLLNRLDSARTLVQSPTKGEETPQTTLPSNHTRIPSTTTDSNSTLSSRQTSFTVTTFRDLLSICNSPDVYDDDAVNTAITILIDASEAHETVSLLLLEPTLLSLYEVLADIHLTPNATPSTRHARLLYDRIKLLNTRKGFREAKNLIGRLKHTRNWSGLDSENIRPLCETLVTYATDPNLSKFHDSAIESLIDLTSSPPPCATVLLEPQFAKRIGGIARSPLRDRPLPNSQAVVASEPDQQFNVSELVRRMSVLALQEELRGNIPRLLALSDHPSPFRLQKVDKEEYQELIDKLLFLYRQKQQDSATFRIIIKSFLIIATGNDIGLDFLINSGSDVIRYLREASSSSLLPNIRTISGSEVVFDMLHDLVRHLEIDADQLLQRSPPLRSRHSIDRSRFNDTFENENDLDRAQALCWRLINICRLDLVNQFTSSALELLGSLVKSSETAYTLFSIDSKLRDALGALGEQNEALTSSVGRIVKLLDDDLIS